MYRLEKRNRSEGERTLEETNKKSACGIATERETAKMQRAKEVCDKKEKEKEERKGDDIESEIEQRA